MKRFSWRSFMGPKNLRYGFVFTLILLVQSGAGLVTQTAFAQSLDNITIELESVVSGLDSPIAVKHAGDGSGNLFIVEQGGRVLIYDGNQLLPTAFLDISSLVLCCGERGLLDIAFHPDYLTNGFFYVHYTDVSGDTVIARYSRSADPLIADPGSATILLTESQPASNHNGGQLEFGPDGFLYIALGDGGIAGTDPSNPAQDLTDLLGKVLRIDIDSGTPYAVPSDNPFVGAGGGVREEIWAYGLRNPWRFSFDRQTGDLLIADVGQNRFEEVSFQAAASSGGENYGWPLMEASSCFNPSSNCNDGSLTLPILEYDHNSGDCSITGGYRYRGSGFPQMNGVYFYGDLCTGKIWGGTADISGSWSSRILLDTAITISTFGEDESGEVYVVDYSGGELLRINQIDIPNMSDDVVLNLPGSGVVVLFNDNTSSLLLHADTATAIATADVDNNGEDDVIASFPAGAGPGGTGGTYISKNQGGLTLLDSKTAEHIAVADVDGNGQKDLVFDFGADGLWLGVNETPPFLFIDLPVSALASGDVDNNGQDDVVFTVTGVATIALKNLATVDILDNSAADTVSVADIDNNGEGDVIASFSAGTGPGGTGGTYISRNQGALTLLDSKIAEQIAAGDVDGNGQKDLVFDFGADGLWLGVNDTSPFLFIDLPPTALATGDLDNNGQDDIVTAFSGIATIVLKNLATVDVLGPGDALGLVTGNVDGN